MEKRRLMSHTTMTALSRVITLCAPLLCLPASAAGLEPLSDSALSSVRGGDGVSFDLNNFSLSGDAKITYTAPTGNTATISNVYLARSDDTSNPFGDPYTLDVRSATGLGDVIELMFPKNSSGIMKWQCAYDWGVNANGIAFDGGSVVIQDLVFYGGGLQLYTPRNSDGIGFGLALNLSIENILLRPRGRDDITNPDSTAEQMRFSKIRLGAVDSNGNFLFDSNGNRVPWRIADAETQPGVINTVTDSNDSTKSNLHIGIDWPDLDRAPQGAAIGGLEIQNISFGNSTSPTQFNLGASRIGTMQIQYLDIRFKP